MSKSTNKASKYAQDGRCYQNIKEKTPSTHLIGFNEVDEIITHLSLLFIWKWNLVDDCFVMVHYEQGVFFSNNNFCHFIALQKKKLKSKGKGRKQKGGRRRKNKKKNVAESLHKGKKRNTEEEHKMKKNLEVKNSFTVLDTRPCKKKIG
jgi:hypothetical protein